MPQSYKEYTGSALTATTFSVPFKYLSINDVNALGFDGTKWNALALHSSTPRSATNKTITLAAAPNTLYSILRLYRATSTTQLIDFQNGSRLSESDLDAAYQQSLFVAQEISEDASTTQFAAVSTAQLQAGTSLSNFASQAFTGNGSTKVFTLTAFAPQTEGAEAYRVSIDGVMQSPIDAYTISMSPAQITFLGTVAPPTGSKIVVVTAASAASAVSVDDVTIGLTSANKAEVKDGAITPAKLSTGAPRWNTNGQLFVDGIPKSGSSSAAGIEINSNLSSGDGYAYIDFQSQSATNTDYDSRIANTAQANLVIQNNTNGKGVYIQTTNSSGTTSTALFANGGGTVMVGGTVSTPYNQTTGTSGNSALAQDGAIYASRYQSVPIAINSFGWTGASSEYRDLQHFYVNGAIRGKLQGNTDNQVRLLNHSDYRLKEDVIDIESSIEKTKQLKPVNFAWKESKNRVDGFIAHELQEVCPDAVSGTKDEVDDEGNPEYQGIDQSKIIPLLTKALQEAITKIETLEARIESLENA